MPWWSYIRTSSLVARDHEMLLLVALSEEGPLIHSTWAAPTPVYALRE